MRKQDKLASKGWFHWYCREQGNAGLLRNDVLSALNIVRMEHLTASNPEIPADGRQFAKQLMRYYINSVRHARQYLYRLPG